MWIFHKMRLHIKLARCFADNEYDKSEGDVTHARPFQNNKNYISISLDYFLPCIPYLFRFSKFIDFYIRIYFYSNEL